MATVVEIVNAGVCGFTTTITAASDDGETVSFEVASDCPSIKALAEAVPEVDAFAELSAGYEGELWKTALSGLTKCCVGCVVPVALYKAMQVAAGLALPADASLHFERK